MEQSSRCGNSARSNSTLTLFCYAALMLSIIMLDRITKVYAFYYCQAEQVFTKYLSCELVINRGISWGIFNAADKIFYYVICAAVVTVTLLLAWYTYKRFCAGQTIYGELLVLSGSLSNIIDRVYYGGVIDFIVFHTRWYTWPVFNIADIAVVLGVLVIVLQLITTNSVKQS